MTDPTKTRAPLLPHHKLIAYGVAVELLLAVKAADIRDAKLRDEAVRAAKGTCLNCAEGAGRVSRADKARVFAIARGEAVEAVAAVEIAAHAGDTTEQAAERCVVIGHRLVALLTGSLTSPAALRGRGAASGSGSGACAGPSRSHKTAHRDHRIRAIAIALCMS